MIEDFKINLLTWQFGTNSSLSSNIWEELYRKFKDIISKEKAKLEELKKLLQEAEQDAKKAMDELEKELEARLAEVKDMGEEIIEQVKKDYESTKKLIQEKIAKVIEEIKEIIKNHEHNSQMH
ncbi:hypothetical protein QAD02_022700 [Eretmocerus hayati]|uniref:Uncharacterized protein n=1 Tax=Eretmocerus hayati TaxID=131215 RepID=A0ACC2PVV3_9HYME|nr:hypothetical protein QAD02_022700 [Eretmocerus hayati]